MLTRIYVLQDEDGLLKRPFVLNSKRYDSEKGWLQKQLSRVRKLILERQPQLEYESEHLQRQVTVRAE